MCGGDFTRLTERRKVGETEIKRADGRVEFVGTGGLPVGLIEGAQYHQFDVTLGAGDRLLIQSDGMVECSDIHGNLLGEEGLHSILAALRQTRGMGCLESIVWQLTAFASGRDVDDDISAVLLEFRPSPCIG